MAADKRRKTGAGGKGFLHVQREVENVLEKHRFCITACEGM